MRIPIRLTPAEETTVRRIAWVVGSLLILAAFAAAVCHAGM